MNLRRSSALGLVLAASLFGCGKKSEAPPPAAGFCSAAEAKPAADAKPADGKPAASGDEMVVKIGSAAPLTGPQAHLGKDNENGVRLALDEANAKGVTIGGKKVRFELVSEDDQADPKLGNVVAQKLVDAKVAGVVGHLNSGTSIPASQVYNDAGIPEITPSATNPKYTHQGFKTAFRVMANDIQQGSVLGEFAAKKLGMKKIAIVDDKSAYGAGLADEFEKAAKAAGAEIVTREYTTDKATDFMSILTNVKGKGAELVFYGGMDAQSGPMMKQVKTLGLTAKFLTGDGGCTPEFLKLAGDAAEGAYCSQAGLPIDKMPAGKEFQTKFNTKYGEIQNYSPYCYDAFNVFVEAMKKADSTDPAKYLPELAKIDYQGVTGHISFDPNGDLQGGAITLYQAKAGKWEVLETSGGAK
jgi:branched-chain amino acid transport system substrate-binding protein